MRCDDGHLLRLLRQDGDAGDDRRAVRHVDRCPRCQQRLLELAGDRQWWSAAREELAEGLPRSRPADPAAAILLAVDPSLAEDVPAAWEPVSLEFLGPARHPEMLGRLGRYEIERLIGAGGMGVVLKSFDTDLHRAVAIKVLAPHLAASGAARARFAREARAAAAVVHDNVIPIYDVQSDAKLPYLVMPFVAGSSLQSRIDQRGPLGVKQSIRIALQAARGLAAAHRQGLVHRDVKPANILLEEGVDRVLISDFGLARTVDDASITRTGILAGTPHYMSPEQARGEMVDYRSDLFSLGSVMYAMLVGFQPFHAQTSYGILRCITDQQPRPLREIDPEIPLWLADIVDRMHAKDRTQRLESADQLADLLERCLAHVQNPATCRLPPCVGNTRRSWLAWCRRPVSFRRMAIAAAAIAATATAAWMHEGRHETPQSAVVAEPVAPDGPDPRALPAPEEPQWEDGIAEQISRIEQDLERLEDSVWSVWEEPVPSPSSADE